jgi:ubiquinone/menaquinone biosynthesis C-methylase UbiE
LSRAGYDVYRDLVNTPAFLALLPPVVGLVGVDLGCGEGHHARILAASGASVVGVDISEVFLRDAAAASDHIGFIHADAAVLPLRTESVDFGQPS